MNRRPLVRSLLASAAIAAAIALGGCDTETTTPAISGRHMQPLSDRMIAEIERRNMEKESPILVRIFKQEAELEVDAVSFTKGCFIGQELVCRIDSRGHVNRFLRRLTAIEGSRPLAGDEIVDESGKVVGAVTSVTPDGVPPLALGYVRREVDPGATVEVRGPSGNASATVTQLRDA